MLAARVGGRVVKTMTVDRKARDDLRTALIDYMSGKIRSYQFADRAEPLWNAKATADYSVREISQQLYYIYDEFIDHPISVTAEGWESLRRALAFLHTELELQKSTECDAWPFGARDEWLHNESSLDNIGLPQYDPAVHGQPANPWWNRIPTTVGLLIIPIGVVVLLIVMGLLLRFGFLWSN
jgi:hypothetical protein